MRSIARSCLIAAIVAGMLNLPVMAANPKSLGIVIQAQGARLSDADAAMGATVYPGDTLATSIGGTLRLKVGSAQLYLLSSSAVTMTENDAAVRATVMRGTVGFSTQAAGALQLDTPLALVRAANDQLAYGQLTIKSPTEMVVSAYRGTLVVDRDGDARTVDEGTSYDVTLEPNPPAAAQGKSGVTPAVDRHLVLKAIVVVGAGVAAYLLWRDLSESPSKPTP